MAKPTYAICRIKKHHQKDITAAAKHNFRDANVPNADPDRKIVPLLGASTSNEYINHISQRFNDWKAKKLAAPRTKRGARMAHSPCVAVEIMLSASPEYFRPGRGANAGVYDDERLKKWTDVVKQFAQSEFGKDIVSLCMHEDECNFHVHLVVMPFDETGNLNAKQLFNRSRLIRLQDKYAEACKPLGLQRGRRGSRAKHTKVKAFYEAVNKPTPTADLSKLKIKGPALPGKVERMSDDKLKEYAASVFKAGARSAEKAMREQFAAMSAKANAFDLYQEKVGEVSDALATLRHTAEQVRTLPLGQVLDKLGAVIVKGKPNVWELPGRRIETDKNKFYDGTGKTGRGAIDLVMRLEGVEYAQAVAWLVREFSPSAIIGDAMKAARDETIAHAGKPAPLPIPKADPSKLNEVENYLIKQKHIAPELVASMVKSNTLYADAYGCAVFKVSGKRGDASISVSTSPDGIDREVVRGNLGAPFELAPLDGENQDEAVVVGSVLDALCYRTLRPQSGWIYAVAGFTRDFVGGLVRKLKGKGKRLINALTASAECVDLADAVRLADATISHDTPAGSDWQQDLADAISPPASSATANAKLKPKLVPRFF